MSKEYRNLFELFDDIFNDEDRRFFPKSYNPNAIGVATPRNIVGQTFFGKPEFFVAPKIRTDVKKIENGFEMTCELPGVKKENIKIDIEENVLKISASISETSEDEKEEDGSKYVKRERYQGNFSRAFNIEGIDKENISAKFENGILTLILLNEEKAPDKNTKTIAIE